MAEYKYNHYVPIVYSKEWCSDNTIWLSDGREWVQKKPEKSLGQNYLYVKTAKDIGALNDKNKNYIFGFLNDYDIEYNGKSLNTTDDYVLMFQNFDDWIIKRDDKLIKKGPINHKIEKSKIKTIEIEFNEIENKWTDTINRVSNIILDSGAGIDQYDILTIKDFAFQLKYRILDFKEQISQDIQLIFEIVKLPAELQKEWKEEFVRSHFIKSMESIQKKSDKGIYQPMYDIIYNSHIVFIVSPEGKKFVTSDNPVLQIVDNTFYKGSMNGLYLPITPKILCCFTSGNATKYTISNIKLKKYQKLNRRLKKNKYEHYFSFNKH